MCIRYIRRYRNCTPSRERPDEEHVLESTIPCSNPIACVGDGFGIQYVTFSGSCEQHTSPAHWTTFDNLVPEEKSFQIAENAEHLAGNISRYVDNLLDFLTCVMDDALVRANGTNYGTLETHVETIAIKIVYCARTKLGKLTQEEIGELRCPICQDDVTVCHCPPGKNRAMYNISRVFRTSEAQRLLATLRPRFPEGQIQTRIEEATGYSAAQNRQEQQKRLLYDFEPPSHGTTVERERKMRDSIQKLQESRKGLFDQGDELGRVQWSAVNIIGSYVKFDSGVPEDIAPFIGRAIIPMLYPEKAIQDKNYRFGFNIDSANKVIRSLVQSTRLTDRDFWQLYQDMIPQFVETAKLNNDKWTDLNAISVSLANRMEDLRNTYHDLRIEERATFYAIAKDLLPVTKHVTIEELEHNLENPPAKCIVCKMAFSTQVQEPVTPAVGTFPATQVREQQVHTPMRYTKCAFLPQEHAFCLREWARQLMNKGQQNRKVIGIKPKRDWRCTTCYVDPWRAK